MKLALNLQLFFSATDDNEDDFDESGEVFDDAASSASTLPIAQACPNTLSVALRQEQINYRTNTKINWSWMRISEIMDTYNMHVEIAVMTCQ